MQQLIGQQTKLKNIEVAPPLSHDVDHRRDAGFLRGERGRQRSIPCPHLHGQRIKYQTIVIPGGQRGVGVGLALTPLTVYHKGRKRYLEANPSRSPRKKMRFDGEKNKKYNYHVRDH